MKDRIKIITVSLPIGEELNQIPQVTPEIISEMMEELKGRCVDLVLFPQYSLSGSSVEGRRDNEELYYRFARSNNCYVVYNALIEKNKKLQCVSVIVDRYGEKAGEYIKTHKVEGIDIDLDTGNDIPVFELDFGKVSLLAGSDIYFPESAEIYSIKGAEILLCSMGTEPLRDDAQVQQLLKSRAVADYLYVAAAAYASNKKMYMTNNFEAISKEDGFSSEKIIDSFNSNGLGLHTGKAVVYDLRGEVIASTGREAGFVECEIDLSKKRNINQYIFGTGCIVYHQNERGIFRHLLEEAEYEKIEYPVRKPVISIVQMDYHDTIYNKSKDWYLKLYEYIKRAAVGSDLVVSSEYSKNESEPSHDTEEDREKINLYSACAKENSCYIAVNDCFDGVNTSLLFDRSGRIIHRYNKVNTLTMMYHSELPAGNTIEVVELDFGKVGFTICADSYCQEIARILGLKGAEIIINQSQSWGYDANSINESIFKAWAIENCLYVVTSAFPSSQVKLRSSIIDPTGETVLASDYDREGIYTARINLDAVRNKVSFIYDRDRVKKDFSFRNRLMTARRPDLYSLLNGSKKI